MKKVLVVSDTHGILDNLKIVSKRERDICHVIHLGDALGQDKWIKEMFKCPVTIVRGNCDAYSENKFEEVVDIDGTKMLATHGHRYGVDCDLMRLYLRARELGCTVALYGHTHIPNIEYKGEVTIANPGSLERPRQANKRPTYAIITIPSGGGRPNVSTCYVKGEQTNDRRI